MHQLTTHKKLDARIIKTLASIENAFLSLLAQKDYDDITVGDILQIANINRTTFYKYYNNKNELAQSMVDSLKNDFFEPILKKRFSLSWEEFSKELPALLDDERQQKVELLWQIKTPKINLKNDFYTLVKTKYINASQHCPQTTAADNLEFQAHLYASFAIAMVEFGFYNEKLEPQECQKNLKRLFERITS